MEVQPLLLNKKTVVYKRDFAIDNLKGILIIAVVLGHGGLLTSFKNTIGNFFQGYIYLFHVLLFLGLSSLFVPNFSWEYFFKRFLQLMVPFYFFVIIDPISILLQFIYPGIHALPLLFDLHLITIIKKVFIGSGYYLQNQLWFLPTLFLSNMLFSIIHTYWFNIWVKLGGIVIFCSVLFFMHYLQTKHYLIPYGIDSAIYIIPFLFTLRYLYHNKTKFLNYSALVPVTSIIFSSWLIIYLIPVNPVYALTGRFDIAQLWVPGTIWGYLLICTLASSIFLFFLRFNKRSSLSFIGSYSLPIFMLHTYPWFNGLQHLSHLLYLLIVVIGNIIIGIGVSKLLIIISPRFSLIGMVK